MANDVVDTSLKLFDLSQELTLTERSAAVVVGLAIAAAGAQPRPNKVFSLLAIVLGSALAIRGAMPAPGRES